MMHSAFWNDGPEHAFPPFSGAGFVHVLVRLYVPRPHRTLHSDHGPHELQPPLTVIINKFTGRKNEIFTNV